MTNQPAGWSYWIHDCDRVQIKGLKVLADVRYPNNDGIHVNCSRDVTISDCIIETGDDSIIVRANSRSLRENKPCERVVVDNCTLRSWSAGIRIGWTNDGVIRDSIFSNIVMHDTTVGISMTLPANPSGPNWTFSGCSFRRTPESELPDPKRHGAGAWRRLSDDMGFVSQHTSGFRFDGTVFDAP